MVEKKQLTQKERDSKIKELKIELVKQSSKRKGIKKELARLLTVANLNKLSGIGAGTNKNK